MNILTIDFETYYDTEYSLRRMTTVEYIMDARFQPIMMSYAFNDEPVQNAIGYVSIKKVLDSVDWSNTILNAQNTMFDGAIVKLRFGHTARFYADTMAMARVTGAHVIAGGASLAKIADFLIKLGYPIPPKGKEVETASGKRLFAMYDDKPYLATKATDDQQKGHQLLMEYVRYCNTDVELARYAFKYFSQFLSSDEMLYGDMILKCYIDPTLQLDLPTIQNEIERINNRDKDRIQELADKYFNGHVPSLRDTCRSAVKFTQFLEYLGGGYDDAGDYRFIIPTKYSEKKGRVEPCYSKTHPPVVDLCDSDDEEIAEIFKMKLALTSSIELSRALRFQSIAKLGVPFGMPYSVSGAHTHRLGGCVVADTKVLCLTETGCIMEKRIVDVLLSDLVWDGEEFCEHQGVVFSGYQKVITYDGITGTPDHQVFINENEAIRLVDAKEQSTRIMDCPTPQDWGFNVEWCSENR